MCRTKTLKNMVNDTSCKVEDCHSELAKNPVKK
jgi:hypothetical protein